MLAKRLQVESGLVQLPSQWRMGEVSVLSPNKHIFRCDQNYFGGKTPAAGLETLPRKRFVLLNVNGKNVLFDVCLDNQ
jgi:hypothetical protein